MKISFFSNIIITIIILNHESCDFQGHGGVSMGMRESKKRNVFVSRYEVKPNPYIINDTLKIKVLNAWVERRWAYGNFFNKTVISKNKYQLIIEVESNTLQDYGLTWMIGIDGDRYVRSCGNNCLISDFNYLPKDKEEWKVQNGGDLDSISNKIVVGSFIILKKND